jgi:hypothetical protein
MLRLFAPGRTSARERLAWGCEPGKKPWDGYQPADPHLYAVTISARCVDLECRICGVISSHSAPRLSAHHYRVFDLALYVHDRLHRREGVIR